MYSLMNNSNISLNVPHSPHYATGHHQYLRCLLGVPSYGHFPAFKCIHCAEFCIKHPLCMCIFDLFL